MSPHIHLKGCHVPHFHHAVLGHRNLPENLREDTVKFAAEHPEMTLVGIGRKCGVTAYTVARWMREYGVERVSLSRNKGNPKMNERMPWPEPQGLEIRQGSSLKGLI